MLGIVTISIFMEHDDNIFLIKSTQRDKEFPLNPRNTGTKLDDLKLDGKSKNELIDIIYDTEKYKLIQRTIYLDGKEYMAVSVLLENLLNNLNIKNQDLYLYPPDKTIIIYFSTIEYIPNKVNEVIKEQNFTILDFFKLFGIKNLLLIIIFFELFNFVIGDKLIEPIIKNFNDIILNYVSGD